METRLVMIQNCGNVSCHICSRDGMGACRTDAKRGTDLLLHDL